MKFYSDIICRLDGAPTTAKYHYHQWSPESIKAYWEVCLENPFIRNQFYPMVYWDDLLRWSARRIERPPTTIADIGCGNGNLIESMRRLYPTSTIHGVDLSESSLTGVRERFKHDSRVRFTIGGFERLPFDDASLDLITCTEVLEHTFPDTFVKSFSEASRVLRKGGYYLASVPFNEALNVVCCPECRSVFTPHQHMMFDITHDQITDLLARNNLRRIDFYQSLDRTEPRHPLKRALKPLVIKWLPGVANRLFPKHGVAGFLARAN